MKRFTYTGTEVIPAGIERLKCRGNFEKLPPLPDSLKILLCYECTYLKKLPKLPEGLRILNCSGCSNLKKMPELPNSLQELICNSCVNLKSLPDFPANLKTLICEKGIIRQKIRTHGVPFGWNGSTHDLLKFIQEIKKKQIERDARQKIALWIYNQGMKPGGYFVRMAKKRFTLRFQSLTGTSNQLPGNCTASPST